MASTPKVGGTSHSPRNKKPATIDLEAKSSETLGDDAKKDAKSVTDTSKKPTTAAADSKAAAEKTATTSDKSASADKSTSAGKQDQGNKPASGNSDKTAGAKNDPAKGTDKAKDTKSSDKKSAESTEKKPTATPAPAPAKSGGGGGGMVSALMGAALAVVGLGAVGQVDNAKDIPFIGPLYGSSGETAQAPAVDASEIEALKQQIAGLESNAGNAAAAAPVDLSPLETKLADLEAQIGAIPAGDGAVDVSGMADRIDTLESTVSELQARPVPTADGEGGATISLEPLETAIADLTSKVTALEAELAESATSGDVEAVANQLPSMTETISGLGEKLSGLAEQTSTMGASVAALTETVENNASGIATLNSQSETLNETVASVKAGEKVARSVAVNAVANALENDDPLTLPIASLKALVGETPETTRLSEIAKQGVPARKALLSELDAFANTVQNPDAPTENSSLTDKFWANAQKLVTFRTTGPREGDDVFAIISRVRANVDADDLSAAKTEWEKLPAEVQQQGEAWLAKMNLRLEAFALQTAISESLSAEAG